MKKQITGILLNADKYQHFILVQLNAGNTVVSSKSSKKLIFQEAQMKKGTLGFPLEACQLLDCRGQNVHMTLVVTTYSRQKQQPFNLHI